MSENRRFILIETKEDLGATPIIPRLLLPTAPTMPAQAVPWSPLTCEGTVPVVASKPFPYTLATKSGWSISKPWSKIATLNIIALWNRPCLVSFDINACIVWVMLSYI